MKTRAIGIEIGGTRTKIGLVNLETGQVESMIVTPTETKDSSRFLHLIGEAIHQLKDRAAAEEVVITGIGIGVPSFVFANGMVDSTYGFLEFMEDYPLADHIQQQHGLPCLLDNDARLVALGEAVYGQGRGYGRVLVLTLGTGLGMGFTIDGKLDGPLPFAHMGGHLTIATSDTVCYCGKTGCLESLVSSSGIIRIANRIGWPQLYPDLPLTAETIFNQKNNENADAEAVVDEYLGYLKTGIDNYVNLYAPDIIVLGGGIAKGLTNDIDTLHNPNLLNPFKAYKTTLVISELEEQAGILGSAALFRE
ncbi:ROK family protein [Spirosoma utsteinense]|uniref:Glucokinase n=1 Tax=Spirosoma utsteinense TaxID=2585773 RepID=A0ABR6WFC7_9BACT|nr:ROK family protein [Spirosoma utsteinense]MBC3789295.1 glucokinase [Spirosoma utsteinense]MBC3795219.1 glucokinase [Spirosoma utsteinense]